MANPIAGKLAQLAEDPAITDSARGYHQSVDRQSLDRPSADRLFAGADFPIPFQFDHRVAQVFDDMVSRSIPFYRQVMELQLCLVREYYQQGTMIYDLGCSTGSTLQLLAEYLDPAPRMTGIDASAAMIAQAEDKLKIGARGSQTIRLKVGDIRSSTYPDASVVLLNYTLQFLPVRDRAQLIRKIGAELLPGGILVISEKVRFDDSRLSELSRRTYEDFKRCNGYSDTEIQRKKEALENVLVPLTRKEQLDLLHEAGFGTVETVFQWNNFVTYLAIKKA